MVLLVNRLAVLSYFGLAVAALLYWAPHYFMRNLHLPMEMTYRYLLATGIPYGLFLISIVARQSILPRFAMSLLMQFLFNSLMLWCALYTFYYPPQANFFASMHLLSGGAFFAVNLYQYRRVLKMRERYQAAEG